ncbi:MAG: hypothetical protein ACXWP0_13465, partial [Ktedonobacterales bacterium]
MQLAGDTQQTESHWKDGSMLAKASTCAVLGLEGARVEVEVDIGHGLPAFTIVGLPDTAVN